ncbi:putative membrane protein [Aequorivita sublithincola DSM 14238]|uniref:Putative membrane protein n=1 Tax=Aequorivita sublithincola (strain DSM 14238 / LMG 21431 / ACAM 643 / 9-3) TaxID=746697 RepID=I3YVJ9_AEQSU|nr:YetF domain-containing protein [Aequorivita sublithincola]AFL81017.1 putative membrane protein [Aequorivita sublithincola DSM 14238]
MNIDTALLVIVSVFAIFTIVLIITRIFGLRTFAKMSSFDFASTISVGAILATIILNNDQSILKGTLALICIIAFQTLFSFLVRKNDSFKKLFTNKPQMLMKDGEIIYDNLKSCNIGMSDLMGKLREANVHKLSEVQAVVFESTGDISVLHSSDKNDVDSIILRDVAEYEK